MDRATLALTLAVLAGPAWGQDLELSRTGPLLVELEREGLLTRREVEDTRSLNRSLPLLAARLQHPAISERLSALLALMDHGSEGLPHLAQALKDRDQTVRRVALGALSALGPAAAPAALRVSELIADPWECGSVRCAAADAVAAMGPLGAPALPALLEGFCSPNGDLREASTRALIAMGPEASPAIPLLLSGLEDALLREPAGRALVACGPAATLGLARVFVGGTEAAREAAERALRSQGQLAVAPLCELLRSPNARDRWTGVRALAILRRGAAAVAQDLAALLADPCPEVRHAAGWALDHAYLGPAAAPAAPIVARLLRHPSVVVRRSAAFAARRMGRNATRAAVPLVWALYDTDIDVRLYAADALLQIVPQRLPVALGPETVHEDAEALLASPPLPPSDPEYVDAWDHRVERRRAALSYHLQRIRLKAVAALGRDGRVGLPALAHGAGTNPDVAVRRECLRALGRFGPCAALAIARGLRDPHPGNRRLAAELLELCGPEGALAAPQLVARLADHDPVPAEQARLSLIAMGDAASSALPELIRVARHEDPDVRKRARQILARLNDSLRSQGRPLWWVPLDVHRESIAGIALLLVAWFVLAARSQRARPGAGALARYTARWGVPPMALAATTVGWAAAGPWTSAFFPRVGPNELPFPLVAAGTAALCSWLVICWCYLHSQRPADVSLAASSARQEGCARTLNRLRGRLRPLPGVSGALIRPRRPQERRAPRA